MKTYWICTEPLHEGGAKVMGPFTNAGYAVEVRNRLELISKPVTYWIDDEESEAVEPVQPQAEKNQFKLQLIYSVAGLLNPKELYNYATPLTEDQAQSLATAISALVDFVTTGNDRDNINHYRIKAKEARLEFQETTE